MKRASFFCGRHRQGEKKRRRPDCASATHRFPGERGKRWKEEEEASLPNFFFFCLGLKDALYSLFPFLPFPQQRAAVVGKSQVFCSFSSRGRGEPYLVGRGGGVRSTQELERGRRRKGLHGLLAKQGKEEEENKGFPHRSRRRIIRSSSIYRHDIMWGIPSCVFLRLGKEGQMLAERRFLERSTVPFTDDTFPRKRNALHLT